MQLRVKHQEASLDSNFSTSSPAKGNPARVQRNTLSNLFSRSFDHDSSSLKSTPNIVLLADSIPDSSLHQIKRQPSNSRKKQLDLEFESPINIRSNLNYNFDESEKEITAERIEESENESKGKLKQNINRQIEPRPNDRQINGFQVNKQIESNIQQTTDKQQIIDKQETNNESINQYRPINENRNRRLNEQQINNRRIKNSRQSYSTQSNFSILRRFYPISQINQLANVNKYTVEDARLATSEIAKLQKEGKCKLPTKRVIAISKLLNKNLNLKKVLPHCTILHRCEQETGCCSIDGEQCTVKSQEIIRLPFWVIELNLNGQQIKILSGFLSLIIRSVNVDLKNK